MNYYEHRIRDYDAATSHLSWDEDLAYTRLIRWYYRKERPIPADVGEACRQIRATTKAHRTAVESVLNEFFELREDGWHKDDCDALIEKFLAGEPEREQKKVNESTRLTRHREERSRLFSIINGAGIHLPYNTSISEVRRVAESVKTRDAETPVSSVSTETPATAQATPATATQYPLPNTHSPIPNQKGINTRPQSPSGSKAQARILKAQDLVAEGVDEASANDWLAVRKAKKAVLTQTAWDAVKREAVTAGLTPAAAVKVAAENNWQGFKASWLTDRGSQSGQRSDDIFAGAR